MRKLLIALCLTFSLGIAAQPASANFTIDYMDGDGYFNSIGQAYGLGGGVVAYVHWCWSVDICVWPDIHTLHSNSVGNPALASLAGGSPGMAYRLWYDGEDAFYFYYLVFVTNNYGGTWTYLGYYPIPW